MASRRATVLVSVVVVVAVAQVVVEDAVVFLAATGAVGPAFLTSPVVLIAVPFGLFILLVATVFAWALTAGTPGE